MSSNKKSNDQPDENRKTRGINRRSFVKILPSIGAAGLALPYLSLSVLEAQAQQQQPQTPPRVSKESMHEAEKLIGIEFTDKEEDMALRGVGGNLTSYEELRKLSIPLDTEPAFAFHPALPGKKFRSEEHTSELQSRSDLVCRLLLEKKKNNT